DYQNQPNNVDATAYERETVNCTQPQPAAASAEDAAKPFTLEDLIAVERSGEQTVERLPIPLPGDAPGGAHRHAEQKQGAHHGPDNAAPDVHALGELLVGAAIAAEKLLKEKSEWHETRQNEKDHDDAAKPVQPQPRFGENFLPDHR